MSILPTSHSQKRIIPLNEAPSLDDIPIVEEPAENNPDSDDEFDESLVAPKTIKPLRLPFYEKWRRKLINFTYDDAKMAGLWLVESAKLDISISVCCYWNDILSAS